MATLPQEVALLRQEVKGEIASLRQEIAALRQEVEGKLASLGQGVEGRFEALKQEVRGEIAGLRGETAALRQEMKAEIDTAVNTAFNRTMVVFVLLSAILALLTLLRG